MVAQLRDPDARDEWNRIFGEGLRAGEMIFPHTRIRGIELAPSALREAVQGLFFGAVIVEI